MNRRNIYAVPDLPIKEIISYFAEMDVELSATDILKPSTPFIQKLYDTILIIFEGQTHSSLDESIQIIKMVQKMGDFLSRIGFQGFTIRDLNPDAKRLIQILSTIINFGMYRDNKRHVYDKVSKIADDNFVIKKEQVRKIQELKDDIENAQNSLQENQNIKISMEEDLAKLEAELKEFIRFQKDKISEVNLLKSEKVELEDRICSSQLLIHNLKQEITCLKTQIVSDPTKLMELVDEMKQLIEKERESIKIIDKNISEETHKLSKIIKTGETIEKIAVLAKELNNIDESIENIEQKNLLLESKLKNWDSNINAIKIRINHIDRQISHLENKITNLQNKDKKCSEEISSKISNLKIRYESVNGEREETMSKIKNNNKLVQEMMYEMAKLGGEHERECGDVISAMVQFNAKFDEYLCQISSCLEN